MKSFNNLKSFALVAVLTLFLASCSHERYGHIQRGTVKAKDVAKVENTTQATEDAVVEPAPAAEVPVVTEAPSNATAVTSFNAEKTVQKAIASQVKAKVSQKIIAKILARTTAPAAHISSPDRVLKALSNNHGTSSKEVDKILLIILAIVIPPLAVGLASDWEDMNALLINIVLTLLCGLPGMIHALIYVSKNA
jgi:uncharacterized membrane protein YqaE (UPF0057 family)